MGNNKIRLQPQEQFRIERVNVLAPADQFPHLPVYFGRKRGRIHTRPNQCRFLSRFGGKIAFVRDANHRIARPNGIEYFRSGGKEGNNAH